MSRNLKVLLESGWKDQLANGIQLEVKDSLNRRWLVSMKEDGDGVAEVEVVEVTTWAIYIEGTFIGVATNLKPEEAVREAFQNAGLSSLPEAVEVKAVGPDGVFMVFTLGGEAYCTTLEQFANEVAKSSNWITSRQARRPEIDALMGEVKKLPRG
jgi:hypothetical protein